MNRPSTRPNKPYTIAQMLDMAEQHFVVDKAPKCYLARDNTGFGLCLYTKTGCFVGFMLTEEDADIIEGPIAEVCRYQPNIYHKYFDYDSLPFLIDGQKLHDNWRFDHGDWTEYMKHGIAKLRDKYLGDKSSQ